MELTRHSRMLSINTVNLLSILSAAETKIYLLLINDTIPLIHRRAKSQTLTRRVEDFVGEMNAIGSSKKSVKKPRNNAGVFRDVTSISSVTFVVSVASNFHSEQILIHIFNYSFG